MEPVFMKATTNKACSKHINRDIHQSTKDLCLTPHKSMRKDWLFINLSSKAFLRDITDSRKRLDVRQLVTSPGFWHLVFVLHLPRLKEHY